MTVLPRRSNNELAKIMQAAPRRGETLLERLLVMRSGQLPLTQQVSGPQTRWLCGAESGSLFESTRFERHSKKRAIISSPETQRKRAHESPLSKRRRLRIVRCSSRLEARLTPEPRRPVDWLNRCRPRRRNVHNTNSEFYHLLSRRSVQLPTRASLGAIVGEPRSRRRA